jgi:exosortase/archaeosortase family protein
VGRGAGAARTARAFAGIGALFCAVGVLAGQARYRGAEASLGARAVRWTLGYPVDAERGMQTLFFGYHHDGKLGLLGLQITLGCSSALLVTPILIVTALLLCFGRMSALRILAAALIAGGLVVGFNVLRLVVIAGLVGVWGPQSGFGWGHTLFGSVLTLVGMSGALAVYWLVVGTRRRPLRLRRRPAPATEGEAAADGDA